MSLIQCTSNCFYQEEGYCNLETAAQITSASNSKGCHHYRTKEIKEQPEQNSTKL